MNLFFSDEIHSSTILLDEQEAIHCSRVLRHNIGDVIHITDGNGSIYTAAIIAVHKNKVACEIQSTNASPKPLKIHIAIAPTKNIDRFEWFLEKSTECGITDITPIITSQSERKVIKPDRLQKIIIAAAKQSLRSWFPVLHPLVRFNEFFSNERHDGQERFIAHCQSEEIPHLYTAAKDQSDRIVLIGPEGDFSNEEIRWAMDHGFREISLGKNRLRTETAGQIACQIIAMKNELNPK